RRGRKPAGDADGTEPKVKGDEDQPVAGTPAPAPRVGRAAERACRLLRLILHVLSFDGPVPEHAVPEPGVRPPRRAPRESGVDAVVPQPQVRPPGPPPPGRVSADSRPR